MLPMPCPSYLCLTSVPTKLRARSMAHTYTHACTLTMHIPVLYHIMYFIYFITLCTNVRYYRYLYSSNQCGILVIMFVIISFVIYNSSNYVCYLITFVI